MKRKSGHHSSKKQDFGISNDGFSLASQQLLLPSVHVVNSIQKLQSQRSGKSVRDNVRTELKAIETAFRRVSRNPRAAIRFLSDAGIVTKTGRLTKEYR